ncbi:MAG TPA: ABC transporter permease [Thermoanaerobaculia bacterium]|nr:ABC transporter permease [Thermoanaerobaculia bacterium]
MTVQDLRYAVRSLRKNPGFSLVVILTLAIALGTTLTMLSLVDTVLLRPLPFSEPDRLVALWDSNPQEGIEKLRVTGGNFLQWQARAKSFDRMALFRFVTFTLTGAGEPVQLVGSSVTADFFPLLGVEPILGRAFQQEDFQPGAPPVVLLSHALWSGHLGSDPAILGRTLRFNGKPFTVTGVLPRQILPQRALPAGRLEVGSADSYFWIPLPEVSPKRNSHLFGVLARLRPGMTLRQAHSEMQTISHALESEFPDTNTGYGVTIVPLIEEAVGDIEASLWVLFGAVIMLLVIAYVNIINLLLVRTDARAKELAVRSALGAGRVQVWRSLVTEGLLLAAAGTIGGGLITFWILRILPAISPEGVPRLDEAALSTRIGMVALILCLASAAVFALVPALRLPRGGEVQKVLRSAGRSVGVTAGSLHFRRLLTAAEMALAVTLVIGSALLVKTLQRLQGVDPGFTARRVLSLELQHREERYPRLQDLTGFYAELFRQIGSLPGVVSTAGTYDPPLTSSWSQSFDIEGGPEAPAGVDRAALYRTVTPSYFETLGARLVDGRVFREDDDTLHAGAAIVNEAFVRTYFPGQNPLGRRLFVPNTEPTWGDEVPSSFTIVGVVGDEKLSGLEAEAEPAFYLPFRQTPHLKMTILVRTTRSDPLALLPEVRKRLRALDPELPIAHAATFEQIAGQAVARPRFNTWVLTTFSLCSLLLAIVGLWGVLSLSARQRTHEIGIRMAVGASRASVFGLMIRHGLTPALAGIIGGVVGAIALSGLLRGLLFGVSPTDPATYVLVTALLLLVSLLACCAPARRASATDPMEVLRAE